MGWDGKMGRWEVGDLSDDCFSYSVNSPLKDTTKNYISEIDNQELDESIEKVSSPNDSDDEVFLGYFTVDSSKEERPVAAPRLRPRTACH